nr:xylulose kinase-1 [Tanacetum cinerariifolium]
MARERERKARTTLLMALPEDHLAKFHKMANAKEMWEAIKSRFEGLHKGYDRFQGDVGYNGNKAKDNGSDNEGNYMPSGPDVEIDYSKFTYGPKQTSVDESDSKPSEYDSCESDSSVKTNTSIPEPVDNAPKVVCEPKVWNDDPIIEEYKSDSDNDSVSNVQEDKEKLSFAFTYSVKHVKTYRENVKETCIPNHSPKIEKQDRNGHTRKGLGYAFTRKACFICGSLSHLIRDYDFHEKRWPNKLNSPKARISHQFTMSNTHQELASPEANGFCKELTSPKQTALGKDKSNPFMADSLPITILLTMLAVKILLIMGYA